MSYLEVAREDLHSFVLNHFDGIVQSLKGLGHKINHVVFYSGFDDLKVICDSVKAKKVDLLKSPIPGLAMWNHNYKSELEKWKEQFYLFDGIGKSPVCAGNLIYMMSDYSALATCQISAVMGETEEDIEKFLVAYKEAVRQNNRKRLPCVLDTAGRRMTSFRPMKWEDIFLAGTLLEDIREEVKVFFKNKKLYDEYGVHYRRGILLTGKPGDGKTSICRAVATEAECPVIYVTLNTGDAFGLLEEVESTIADNSPCIVIFEDADSIGADPVLRSRLLNMLDGMCSRDGVLTIATTNSPEKLDAALTGRPSRFDSLYVIADPTEVEIEKILKKHLRNKADISASDMKKVISILIGFSAAATQEAAWTALVTCMNRSKKKVLAADLIDAAHKVKKHMLASKKGDMEDEKRGEGFSDITQAPLNIFGIGRSGRRHRRKNI